MATATGTPTIAERDALAAVPGGLLIGENWDELSDRPRIAVEDPATGATLAEVPDAGVPEALDAVRHAAEAQPAWAATPPRARGEILRRAFELIIERRDTFALLLTMEMGKPLAESQAEVAYGAEFLRWFSEEPVRISGRYAEHPDGTGRILTRPQPVGPCLLITPWNFPLAMPTRKLGPAIAAGCTMVLKPAKQTPLTALFLAQTMLDAGLPAGVLNVIVSGRSGEVAQAMIADGRIRKVSFTGSTEVGRTLLELCANRVLRTSMELGGNAPLIVFDDADVNRAVDGAMVAKLRNGGESCTASNRIYVQAGIADEFTEAFAQRVGGLRLGRGTENVDVGPLIDEPTRSKVDELVRDATERGGRILTGGRGLDGPGYFYTPTVLDQVPPDARMLDEEIFGPVVPVTTFRTEDEVVAAANRTEYGLVSYMFTQDLDRALRVSDRLDTGMVGINQGIVSNPAAPFGGIKQSGIGKEGGVEGIDEYLSYKYLAIASPPHAPDLDLRSADEG
jgi:succinate-semialdehyde dehydrogenase/glutarate-semialdehyde dehydrogenase